MQFGRGHIDSSRRQMINESLMEFDADFRVNLPDSLAKPLKENIQQFVKGNQRLQTTRPD